MIQINRHPSTRELRLFAGLMFPAFWGLVAFLTYSRGGHPRLALWIAVSAAVISVAGLLSPRFIRLVYLGMAYATYPIGFVMSHILLSMVYYLVLTPIAFLMRRLGRDPMKRDADPETTTYWITKEEPTDNDRYFHQY